tara:strand:- start:639 stop:2585 length:1947 start_codon:yes stop_codon:yes gene_type:complete
MRQVVSSSRNPSYRASALTALAASILLMQTNTTHAETGKGVTTINNIAQIDYSIESTQQSGTSNQVSFKSLSLPLYDVSLTQPSLQTISRGKTVEWVNILSNNGTYDETIALSYDYSSTLSNFKVYQDINKNGLIDDNELALTDPSQIKIGQGESIQLIIQALLDSDVNDGDIADIKIGAIVVNDESVTASATDRLIVVEPSIKFTNADFNDTAGTSQVGEKVYVKASYAQCNVQPEKPDQVWVTIKSPKTGDSYSLKAVETGNNTGKYHLSASTQNNANAIDDEIIQTLEGDDLVVSLDACIAPSVDLNEQPNQSDLDYITGNISSNVAIIDNSSTLKVEKEGDVKAAEFGDYVNYTIKVTNDGKVPVYNVELKDALPRGFDYVDNSVRVSPSSDLNINQAQTTEFKAEGKYQVLNLGTLTAGETKNITYRVLIGSSALGGDGINRATAHGRDENNNTLASLEAQWPIEVSRGVMNTDGIIVGKVYHDINRDGIQQKEDGELGVAGVRIYMENGNFIVTDPEGKYNFYGISAKTHVLKVDRTTIPRATELVTQSNRNAGDAGSRFVDLKYGELHRADFAIVSGMADSTERLNQELVTRSKSLSAKNNALEQAVKTELTLEPDYNTDTTDNVDASGCNINGDLDIGNN